MNCPMCNEPQVIVVWTEECFSPVIETNDNSIRTFKARSVNQEDYKLRCLACEYEWRHADWKIFVED